MSSVQASAPPSASPDKLSAAAGKLAAVRDEIAKVVYGQTHAIDLILTTLLSGGHVLLVGVPGLAKTLMVETVAKVLGLSTSRVQCTPDLMPADILGSEILDQDDKGRRSFRFIQGPVFTQLLMADEINRASPRTQSALLQAMQEKSVTVAGKHYDMATPFHVLATQNPIEQEGTYPLPEAQLDRFLMQIDVDYPTADEEKRMIVATTAAERAQAKPVLNAAELESLQSLVRDIPVGESVVEAILDIVRKGRPGPAAPKIVNDYVSWPPGPRAAQALMLAVRAKALIEGRAAPSVEDAVALAGPVLKHRMALNYRARTDGMTLADIIATLTKDL